MNKQKPDGLDVLFYAVIFMIAVLILLSATSCSSLKKYKSVTKTDSTSVVKEKTQLSSNIEVTKSSKEGSTEIHKNDSAKTNEHTTIEEETTKTEFDSTGKIKAITTTKKKTESKKQKEKTSESSLADHSKIDTSHLKQNVDLSKEKSDSTHLKNDVKVKDKTPVFNLLWLLWLLLIPAGAWVWSKRKSIASWVIHKATGV